MEDKPETTKQEHPEVMTRSLSMAAAVAIAPTAAVVANHLLNKPKDDRPPKVALPPRRREGLSVFTLWSVIPGENGETGLSVAQV